ncbi:MAG: hypothetical protein VKJ66_05265 [Synechococcus sp.]|nr:hypothetical protein [Synechococcus sp.]
MARRSRGSRPARFIRRALSVVLWAVALAGGITSLVSLAGVTLWGLLYCTVKPPLECALSLVVMALWWGAAAFGVGLAVVGARRLWRER